MKQPRSQTASPAAKTVFSSVHGTVRVYTRRHINGCELADTNENRCSCPKWLYKNARGSKPLQEGARTPSFTEACEVAQKWLRGLDPEIRAARELLAPAPGITAEEALERYLGVLARRKLSRSYMAGTINLVFRRRHVTATYHGHRRLNLSLLDFLDEQSRALGHPVRLEEISGTMLDAWASGWGTNDLSSKQWRDVARGFFKWAAGRELMIRVPSFDEGESIKKGNRCGHFEDAQYASLIKTLPFIRFRSMPDSYAARMRAFLELGRWAGMAVVDIINFRPDRQLSPENVIRYQRQKTGEWGEVALYPEVADRLRHIPEEPGSLIDRPLSFAGRSEHAIGEIWRHRFRKLCAAAGIAEITTEHGARRKPHPHMLRDTCAIDAISQGVDIDNVARMLGHKNIQVTQRSYLCWIAKRSQHCIEDQRAALTRRRMLSAPGGDDALRSALVQ